MEKMLKVSDVQENSHISKNTAWFDLSYLKQEEQNSLANLIKEKNYKISMNIAQS